MKRRLIICTLLLLLISGSVLAWVYRAPLTHFYHTHIVKTPSPEDDKPKPDPVRYKALIAELAQKRETLSKRYTESRTEDETDQVLAETRALLEETLPQLMRCWLGTDYDFNGTTDTPGTGKIACGYYVSTVMRDAISIVGLDTHVAFLVVTPELDVRFIHSSGGYEKCVVDQDPTQLKKKAPRT